MFHVVYVCHHSNPIILNLEDFRAHLSLSRYIWKPELDVDSLIQQLDIQDQTRVHIKPIYRSLNLTCCTGVVAVVHTGTEWIANDHMDEILEANLWYSNKLLVERPDRSLVAITKPTMAAVINHNIIPLTEHNGRELQYLQSKRSDLNLEDLDVGSSTVPIAYLPNGPVIMYLEIPRRQSNWTIEQWLGGSPSNINWFNFLTGTRPYVYGREGRYREPAPLAEV